MCAMVLLGEMIGNFEVEKAGYREGEKAGAAAGLTPATSK
jgi:hypothetical protein